MKFIIITLLTLFTSTIYSQTQESIDNALYQSFETQSLTPLLENLETIDSDDYWTSYNLYLQSVYLLKTGGEYEETLQKSYNTLLGKDEKNSEDYALLAITQSMLMSTYSDVADLMRGENNFYQYVETGRKLDPNNPRIYYAAALYDYHKPEAYGGGQMAAKYLEKAISLFESQTGEITWGAEHAQELMIEIQAK